MCGEAGASSDLQLALDMLGFWHRFNHVMELNIVCPN